MRERPYHRDDCRAVRTQAPKDCTCGQSRKLARVYADGTIEEVVTAPREYETRDGRRWKVPARTRGKL